MYDAICDESASEDKAVVGEGHVAVAVRTRDSSAEQQLAQGVRVELEARRGNERTDRYEEGARRL
jgi:hypothetical protein